MNGWWLILICVSLVAGILSGNLNFVSAWMAAVPVALAMLVLLFAVAKGRINRFLRPYTLNTISATLVFFGVGIFSACLNKPNVTSFDAGEYEFSGKIEDYTASNFGDKCLVSLCSLSSPDCCTLNPRNIKALVTVPEATDLTFGDMIYGTADLLPYDAPGNYLKPDYENYLKSKHIYLVGTAVVGKYHISEGHDDFLSRFQKVRDNLEADIEKTELDSATKNFIISLLLGDKTYINSSDRITFADAGVAHIFAVSGFHVSLVAMFLIAIFSLLFTGKWRPLVFLCSLPVLWSYILLVGLSPATLRAGIMITIGLLALVLQRKNNPGRSLAWAVVIILSFNAEALFDVGFQLSVVCVGSLLFIARPLNFINHRQHPRLHSLVSAVLVTLTATFSCWIICAFYFHRFSLMFLPLNLLAVPLIPLFIALALIYIVFFHIGLHLTFLESLLDRSFSLFKEGAEYFTSLTVPIENLHPTVFTVLIWIAGIGALGFFLSSKSQWKGRRTSMIKRLSIPSSLLSAALISFVQYPAPQPSGMIIQRNSSEATIMNYENGRERLLKLPSDGSALCRVNGKTIVSLRSSALSSLLRKALKEADIILLCKGCKELPEELSKLRKLESVVVTHPSLHWRYERAIRDKASEFELPVYSLRYDGPLHLF